MKKPIFKRPLRLVLGLLGSIAGFWWAFSGGGVREALIMVAMILPLGFLLGMVGVSFRLKDAFVRLFEPGSLRMGNVEEFPHLNRAELERLTKCWQQLGFERSIDRAGNMDNQAYGQTFSRTLEHPEQGAIIEISQTFMPDQIGPITSSIISFWGERAPVLQGAQQLQRARENKAPLAPPGAQPSATSPDEMELWALATHNRAPNKFWSLLRQKRLLSRRMASDVAPENLWRAHLEQRAEIESRLQLPHETGDLEALLDAYNIVLSAHLHARLGRTAAWKFGLARLSHTHAPDRYDGELPI